VPYYSDYVSEARQSALKSNLANIRKVLEDFKGDHGRGPFFNTVYIATNNDNAIEYQCGFPQANINELVAGVVPTFKAWQEGLKTRRTNLKYLNHFPLLEDQYGVAGTISIATSTLWFKDGTGGGTNHVGFFDIGLESFFYDLNGTGAFEATYDQIGSGVAGDFEAGIASVDVAQINFVDSKGNKY